MCVVVLLEKKGNLGFVRLIDMDPNSSDGEVNDGSRSGSSSDPELNEPIEISTGVSFSLLGKRRAETSDSGESDEESVEDKLDEDSDREETEEGDGESYRNEEPEWGYDSFDGREDDSSNLREYSDKEFEEQCCHYKRQLIETKVYHPPLSSCLFKFRLILKRISC